MDCACGHPDRKEYRHTIRVCQSWNSIPQEKISRNEKVASSFTQYLMEHPEQRFWQALRNWAGVGFVYTQKTGQFLVKANAMDGQDVQLVDTFYFEGKDS